MYSNCVCLDRPFKRTVVYSSLFSSDIDRMRVCVNLRGENAEKRGQCRSRKRISTTPTSWGERATSQTNHCITQTPNGPMIEWTTNGLGFEAETTSNGSNGEDLSLGCWVVRRSIGCLLHERASPYRQCTHSKDAYVSQVWAAACLAHSPPPSNLKRQLSQVSSSFVDNFCSPHLNEYVKSGPDLE